MTIRFTHTEKWEDAWFRRLTPAEKLLFLYVIDRCDIAGIWEKDLELAGFITGLNSDTQGAYQGLATRIIPLDETHDIVKNFVKRQRNLPLNPENAAHVGIINRLLAHKENSFVKQLLNTPEIIGATQGLLSPICISKGKGKGKSISNKGVVGGKEKKVFVPPTLEEVKAYCAENHYQVDAQEFVRYYAAAAWHSQDGKPVKNWKQKIIAVWSKNSPGVSTKKLRLLPIVGRSCSRPGCKMPAVYKDASGAYDNYLCSAHLPESVKVQYE